MDSLLQYAKYYKQAFGRIRETSPLSGSTPVMSWESGASTRKRTTVVLSMKGLFWSVVQIRKAPSLIRSLFPFSDRLPHPSKYVTNLKIPCISKFWYSPLAIHDVGPQCH
jgi:hypothetical protein